MENLILFKDLPEKFLKTYFYLKEYRSGSLIFNEGEICNKVGVIINGELTITTLTYEDKEYTINILHNSDVFGEILLFEKNSKYLGDGIVTKDTTIAYISKEKLFMALKNEVFLNNYLMCISKRFESINQRVKLLSQRSLKDKIIFYLISEKKKTNSSIVPIENKEKLAGIFNVPRPSLSRELAILKKEKIIDYDKYSIKLLI